MKKYLSSLLIRVALWLYPANKEKLAPVVEGYTAGKVGCTFQFGKKEIREWQKTYGGSHRKALREQIKEHKKMVKVSIAKTIGDMVEFEVNKHVNGATISGHIKVYKTDGSTKA